MKKKIASLVLLFGVVVGGLMSIASCGSENIDDGNTEFIDYVKTSEVVRLKHDYKDENGNNRNFFTDGISQVDLAYKIDGDTSHFRMKDQSNSELIKIRYYGIDTPESTGSVEPYGGKAKDFTNSKLDAANEHGTIVITSTNLNDYIAPEPDSTGSRYLGMVWINEEKENAPFDELYLLNLWIVQEGYSYVKSVDKFPEFADIFYDAESQARSLKLNLFSGEPDEDYNYGDYETTDLQKIKEEVVKNLNDSSYVNIYENKRVRVRGTVAGYANRILYLQTSFEDEDTGVINYAGINIFTGMSPVPSKFTTYNAFIEVCGLCQTSENFGFQITDVYMPRVSRGDDNESSVIYSASETPDEFKVNEFALNAASLVNDNDYLFSPVQIKETLTVVDGYEGDGGEMTLYCTANGTKTPFNLYVPFIYGPDPNDKSYKYTDVEDYIGHEFEVKGIYNFHKTTSGKVNYQIIARDENDLIQVR